MRMRAMDLPTTFEKNPPTAALEAPRAASRILRLLCAFLKRTFAAT